MLPTDLFLAPTIDQLAALIRQKPKEGESSPIISTHLQDCFPLSFAQERLWFMDSFISEKAIYNISLAFIIKGKLNIEILKEAFDLLLFRHEMLRTVFLTMERGLLYQKIQENIPFQLEIIDLSTKPEVLQNLIEEESKKPFILTKGPLICCKLFQMDQEQYTFSLTMHHIVGDEASLEILFREISEIYHSLEREKISALPSLMNNLKILPSGNVNGFGRELLQGNWLIGKNSYSKYLRSFNYPPINLGLPHHIFNELFILTIFPKIF